MIVIEVKCVLCVKKIHNLQYGKQQIKSFVRRMWTAAFEEYLLKIPFLHVRDVLELFLDEADTLVLILLLFQMFVWYSNLRTVLNDL